ncbi:hypothetical protein FOMPIDRAFT_1086640, partial [Fomitopsis schrenkii]
AIWCYDYVLTLDREIKYFWGEKWSLNRILFLGYRYPGMANTIIVVLTTIPWHWQTIPVRFPLLQCMNVYSAFAALRVYALFRQSLFLCAIVLFSGMLNPAIFIYIFSRTTISGLRYLQGCAFGIAGGTMIARAASVVSDGIVLVLTLMKTYR